MPEWWFSQGRNMLKGVEGDTSNPPRLPAAHIVDFLRRIPAAKKSFERLFPNLLPEEQARLQDILDKNPSALMLTQDERAEHDRFQSKLNKQGIYTTGPRGGGVASGRLYDK